MTGGKITITNLSVVFDTRQGEVRAVDGVNINAAPGERAALLGESGCGKSVLALAMLNLLPSNARITGSVLIDGVDVTDPGEAHRIRGRIVSLCWSNAERFFNPVLTVGDQIVEAFTAHHPGEKQTGREKALLLLDRLGFVSPAKVMSSYPFQLSGGMNQRAMIAMSLINDPAVLIVDEPTRGLDDTNRDHVIEAVKSLENVTLLLITHDVDCALQCTETTYIMKSGVIVDSGLSPELLLNPVHPYTRRLVRSCPHFWDEDVSGQVPALNHTHLRHGGM